MSPIKEAIEAPTEVVDQVCDALIQAWTLGQYYRGHNDRGDQLGAFKAQEIHTKFVALLDKTRAALAALRSMPAEPVNDALNTLCKMLHSGEEVEGDDGLAMLVPMDLWNEAQEAIELLVGEDDAAPPPAPVLSDAWIKANHDLAVENHALKEHIAALNRGESPTFYPLKGHKEHQTRQTPYGPATSYQAVTPEPHCRYPDCKCPTESPCLQGLPPAPIGRASRGAS